MVDIAVTSFDRTVRLWSNDHVDTKCTDAVRRALLELRERLAAKRGDVGQPGGEWEAGREMGLGKAILLVDEALRSLEPENSEGQPQAVDSSPLD